VTILIGIVSLILVIVFPAWLGATNQSWFWLLIVGVPTAFVTKFSVSYNLLRTEWVRKNFGGVITWFVAQTLVYAVVTTIPYMIARWVAG
jgi:hypothetical protein